MKVQDVLTCSFASWYPFFQKITIKSKILALPQEFIDYLLADNLVLGDTCQPPGDYRENSSDSEESDGEWDETPSLDAPSFKELDAEVTSAIAELGGKVFTKLNWSSPRDASWIALNNSLQCVVPADIHLLFKSSDFILHDLTQPFKDCEDKSDETPSVTDFHLVLRKWIDIHPGSEFRCFVKNKNLIAISQRDDTQYYPFIGANREDIIKDITSFYKEQIQPKFPLDDYVIDVFRSKKDSVKLVDFNPFGITTDAILFDWNEEPLTDPAESTTEWDGTPVFHYVNVDSGIQANPLRRYGVPEDVVHLASGQDPYKLIDLLNLQSQNGLDDELSD